MCEHVKKRSNFKDIDIINTSYILYDPYNETLSCEDYEYGKTKDIILRNKKTGELEQIKFKFSGAVPFSSRTGYHWFWGDVESEDYNCCLLFDFWSNGKPKSTAIVFCGKSISSDNFHKANEKITYAAEITAIGRFGSIKL